MVTLKQGDTIGVVAPSAPISSFCARRTERGIAVLKRMGFKVKIGKTVKRATDFTAGSAQERIKDIHGMFLDKDVKAIIATIGGYNANDLLDGLDYNLIRRYNEKLFIGYSDIVVLLINLLEKSGVQTIMGPMLLPQFGEYPEILDFTKDSFLSVVSQLGSKKEYVLPVSKEITEEKLWWDKKDNRGRKMSKNEGWKIINSGEAEGKLMAVNLNTLMRLAGTKYFPNLKNSILFIEDDEEENPSTIQRMLRQLKQTGAMKHVKGLVFGRFQEKSELSKKKLKGILTRVFGKLNIPIMASVDFGHTDPMLSLPLGKKTKLSTFSKEIKIVL